MNISDKSTANVIINAITTTGIKAPKLIDAWAETKRVTAEVRNLAPTPDMLGAAVTAAITARRDPTTDPEVQRLVAADRISNEFIWASVEAAALDRFHGVVADMSDTLVEAWIKSFTQHTEKLTAAFRRIGPVPLDATGEILARGGDIAQVWADAQAANQALQGIESAWVALCQFAGPFVLNIENRVLRICDQVTLEQWQTLSLQRRQVTPWEALLLGLTPSLTTYAGYQQRVQALVDAEQRTHEHVDTARSAIAGRQIVATR